MLWWYCITNHSQGGCISWGLNFQIHKIWHYTIFFRLFWWAVFSDSSIPCHSVSSFCNQSIWPIDSTVLNQAPLVTFHFLLHQQFHKQSQCSIKQSFYNQFFWMTSNENIAPTTRFLHVIDSINFYKYFLVENLMPATLFKHVWMEVTTDCESSPSRMIPLINRLIGIMIGHDNSRLERPRSENHNFQTCCKNMSLHRPENTASVLIWSLFGVCETLLCNVTVPSGTVHMDVGDFVLLVMQEA